MAVNDVFQVTAVMRQGEQEGLNVRHFRVSTETLLGVTGGEIATALDALFRPLYRAVISAEAQWVGMTAQRIRPLPPLVAGSSPGAPQAGLQAGDVLPRQVAGITTFRTAKAGRAFRGRIYYPFMPEPQNQAGGIPDPTFVELLDAVANEWDDVQTVVGIGGTATLNPVIYHRSTGMTDDIIGRQTRFVWATQRRRGSYGRPNPTVQ